MSTPSKGPIGPCFACGKLGHLRSFCPKIVGVPSNKQWYPHSDEWVMIQSEGVSGVDNSVECDVECMHYSEMMLN